MSATGYFSLHRVDQSPTNPTLNTCSDRACAAFLASLFQWAACSIPQVGTCYVFCGRNMPTRVPLTCPDCSAVLQAALTPPQGARGDLGQQHELHSPSIAAVPAEQGIERSLQKVEICFADRERARHRKTKQNKTKIQTFTFKFLAAPHCQGNHPSPQHWALGCLLPADFAICAALLGTSSDLAALFHLPSWMASSPKRALETAKWQGQASREGGLADGQRDVTSTGVHGDG